MYVHCTYLFVYLCPFHLAIGLMDFGMWVGVLLTLDPQIASKIQPKNQSIIIKIILYFYFLPGGRSLKWQIMKVLHLIKTKWSKIFFILYDNGGMTVMLYVAKRIFLSLIVYEHRIFCADSHRVILPLNSKVWLLFNFFTIFFFVLILNTNFLISRRTFHVYLNFSLTTYLLRALSFNLS